MKQKIITNESLQVLEVFIRTPIGVKSFILAPHEKRVIPADFISDNIKKLNSRRMISVQHYN